MDFLGRKLLQLREEKQTSSEVVSEVTGVELNLLRAYENGRKQLTIRHLNVLANYFEISVDQLLERAPLSVQKDEGGYEKGPFLVYKKEGDITFRK